MPTFLKDTVDYIEIYIVDAATRLGVPGIAWDAAGLSFKIGKPGAANVTYTLTGPTDWVDKGNGLYNVKLSITAVGYGVAALDTVGECGLLVLLSGAEGFYPFTVRANTEAQIVALIGSPAGGTLAAALAAILVRVKAVLGENTVRADFAYTELDDGLGTSWLYVYDTKANATTHDGATGLQFKCKVTMTYAAAQQFQKILQTLEP